jgi:hypothetical protein
MELIVVGLVDVEIGRSADVTPESVQDRIGVVGREIPGTYQM